MSGSASATVRSLLLTAALLVGWALIVAGLYHAKWGLPKPWFYQPFTLLAWLGGVALIVPILWRDGRRIDRGPWGVPIWDLESQSAEKSWLPAVAFWTTAAVLAVLLWHRLYTDEWSPLLITVAALIAAQWIVLLLVLKPDGLAQRIDWARVIAFAATLVAIACVGYFLFYSPQHRWYPGLLVILVLTLGFALSYRRPWPHAAALAAAATLAILGGWLYYYREAWFTSFYLWLASLAVAIVPFYLVRKASAERQWRFERWEYAFLGGLVLAAALLRMWDLRDIPPHIHIDEALDGLAALSILHGVQANPFGTVHYELTNTSYYLFVPGLVLFKNPIVATRMVTAFCGMLAVALCYVFVREMFGRLAAVLSSLLLCVGYMAIHWSRIGMCNGFMAIFALAVVYLLWRAHAPGATERDFVWLGLALGLSQYGFPALHVLPIIVALFPAYLLLTRPREVLLRVQGWSVALLVFLVVMTPLLTRARLGDFYSESLRTKQVAIWNNFDMYPEDAYARDPQAFFWRVEGLNKTVKIACSQFFDVFTFPFYGFDGSGHSFYGKGLLDFGSGVLFLVGVTFCFLSWHRPKYALLNIWYWSVIVVGGVLTAGSPYSARLVPAFPVVAIMAGLALAGTIRRLAAWAGRRATAATVALSAAAMIPIGLYNYHLYFNDYIGRDQRYYHDPVDPSLLVRECIWKLDPSRAYLVMMTGGDAHWMRPEFRYLIPQFDGEGYGGPVSAFPPTRRVDKDLAFIADPYYFDRLRSELPALYPGGQFHSVQVHGEQKFLVYYVTREQVAARCREWVMEGKLAEAWDRPERAPAWDAGEPSPIVATRELPAITDTGEELPPLEPDEPPSIWDVGKPRHRGIAPQNRPPSEPPIGLPDAAQVIEAACPGWRVLALRREALVGAFAVGPDAHAEIVLHPVSNVEPGVIEWRGQLPADEQWTLSFEAAPHSTVRAADAAFRVYVNGEMLDEQVLRPRRPERFAWRSFSYDLSEWAGQDVRIQIWSVANGWWYEFLHLARLRVGRELQPNDRD